MDLFKYYHKKTWIYKKSYSCKRNLNYFINLISILLASVGVITGGITLNSIVLSALTTSRILFKSYAEMKSYKGKTDLIKFGSTTCEKVLTNLRSALRGEEFDYKNSLLKYNF